MYWSMYVLPALYLYIWDTLFITFYRYLYLSAQRWFQLRLLLLSTVYFAAVVLLAVALPGQSMYVQVSPIDSEGGGFILILTWHLSVL